MQLDGCVVQYSTDSSFRNLSPPVWGPMNSPFALPAPTEEVVMYFYQATVTVSNSLIVVIHGNQEAQDCIIDSKKNVGVFCISLHVHS